MDEWVNSQAKCNQTALGVGARMNEWVSGNKAWMNNFMNMNGQIDT